MARSRRYSYRKPAAELICGWEVADGHLEKRHLSSGLSRGLFPRGGKIINAFPLRATALLYRKSRPYGGLLNRGGFIKERMESCRAVEGSRVPGDRSGRSFVSPGRNRHAMRETDYTLKKKKERGVAKTPARPSLHLQTRQTSRLNGQHWRGKKKEKRADNTSLRTFGRFACSIWIIFIKILMSQVSAP